jgi:hypothetical protein
VNEYRALVWGRILRRSFNWGHVYDKPSEREELDRLNEVMREGQGLLGNTTNTTPAN